MSKIDYSNAPYAIRQDFEDGHNRYWERLAQSGSWLTAKEKVDVARELRQARNCKLCKERKTALSPYQVEGAHETVTLLPDTIVELIHRVATDPGRLTKTWFDGLIQQGLSVEKYIEVLGTLVCMMSIDEFCRGLGMPLNELPEPQAGDPDNYRPDNLTDNAGAWVPMLKEHINSGPEADLWETDTGNVVRALSLVPNQVRYMLDLLNVHYLSDEQYWDVTESPKGTLTRAQMEIVASRVSALNGCFY